MLADYKRGWEGYLASLRALPALADSTGDGGRLLYASALVLKVCEDKTHSGALIAALATPWGASAPVDGPATGYRAVWPRDFYHSATALLALGDTATPLAALRFLSSVQVHPHTPGNRGASGWFLQKSHVDGTPEWTGVQMDETAMPIMLAWKLWHAGLLDRAALAGLFGSSLRPAADFLAMGGEVGFLTNQVRITPPMTQQERWEEQCGASPSTIAAVIAGLVSAAELADGVGDHEAGERYRAAADADVAALKRMTVVRQPAWGGMPYFLRIAPWGTPDGGQRLVPRNGQGALQQARELDAGFLELVRYGVLSPNDPDIVHSLAAIDDVSMPDYWRVRYDLRVAGAMVPGFRRYGGDGYGEDTRRGADWTVNDPPAAQRGRVWPLLTGERGEYAVALDAAAPGGLTAAERNTLRERYVHGMELFANEGLMLPEQVWDGVGSDATHHYPVGSGTESATPLVWSHAEYIKLVRSVRDGAVWDMYAPVRARYGRAPLR